MEVEMTIDRLGSDKAILKTIDEEEIIWPLDKLPEGITEGGKIFFSINHASKPETKNKNFSWLSGGGRWPQRSPCYKSWFQKRCK